MKRKAIIAAYVFSWCVQSTSAVDGIAVTNRCDCPWQNYGVLGDLWRYDILDDEVTDSACIFKGKARAAKISMDGKKVTFIRQQNDGFYVSVISVDGGTPVDLVKISGGSAECHVAWPAGSWIYYNEGKNANDKTLRRVHADNPSHNEKLGTLSGENWIRVWDMSADGTRINYQVKGYGNRVTTVDNIGNGKQSEVGSCNPAISPGGNWLCGLNDAGHSVLKIADWEKCEQDDPNTIKVENKTEVSAWAGLSEPIGGMDKNNFSANSDKWICIRIGWPGTAERKGGRWGRNGTVQVVVNWIDKKAILTTRNNPQPRNDSDPRFTSECGDFLVAGIQGVETVERSSLAARRPRGMSEVKTASLSHADIRLGIINGKSAVILGPGARYSIQAFDAKGGVRLIENATGTSLTAHASCSDGVYFIRTENILR